MLKRIEQIIENKGGLGKTIRYLIVGSSSAVIDFAIFRVLILIWGANVNIIIWGILIKPEKIANTIATLVGFFYGFVLNRKWAFHSNRPAILQIIYLSVLLILNIYISSELISFMGRNLVIPFSLSKIIMQALVALWNYLIYDKIIYTKSK